jgi:hypothetical protein
VRAAAALAALALAGGCARLPQDPDGTLDRVRREHAFRVGLVDGPVDPRAAAHLGRVARATGARPRLTRGQTEPLLLALEAGELDLVANARFVKDTPWKARVALGPAFGEGPVRLRAAARNGENAWVTLVEREAHAMGAR